MPLDSVQQQLVLRYDVKYRLVGDGTPGTPTSINCLELRNTPDDLQSIKKILQDADDTDFNNVTYGEALVSLRDLIELWAL